MNEAQRIAASEIKCPACKFNGSGWHPAITAQGSFQRFIVCPSCGVLMASPDTLKSMNIIRNADKKGDE